MNVIVGHHFISTRVAKKKRADKGKYWKGMEQLELSYIAGRNIKYSTITLEIWQLLVKLYIPLPYDPAILFLIIAQEKWKYVPKTLVQECL